MVLRHQFDVVTWFWLAFGSWCRDPIFGVATWAVLVGQKGGRDMGLMSRPGLVVQEVATWERCCDLAWGRLPWRVATSARPACARPALAARATSLLCAQQLPRHGHCARSVRATWVLGVRTVHPTQFCDSALFRVTVWTLFMDTVQEHYSQGKKKRVQKF